MSDKFFPVCLKVSSFKILIVGGGHLAYQKLKGLLPFGGRATVIAKEASPEVKKLAQGKRIRLVLRAFRASDLRQYSTVYACTDDAHLNRRIGMLAKRQRILFNVTNHIPLSNFISTALYRGKGFLLAVSTSGRQPARAVSIRNTLKRNILSKKIKL